MARPQSFLLALSAVISFASFANAQIGVAYGPANSSLACTASGAGVPALRPEGYTELLGDLLIACTGGPTFQVGASIPTTNVIIYITPSVPITSRALGPGAQLAGYGNNTYVSEALLIHIT